MKTHVLIVEDHPLVRQAISYVLDSGTEFQVCGQAEDTKSTLALIEKTSPEIVILDVTLKNCDGFSVLKEIQTQFPAVKVFFFSAHDESDYGLRAIRAGAHGYLMKGESHEELLTGLRKIKQGEIYLSEKLKAEYLHCGLEGENTRSSFALLTEREIDVFKLIGEGFPTEEIATRLDVSINTVQSHRASIRQKMQLGSSPDLMRCAVEFVNHGTISKPQAEPETNHWSASKETRIEAILELLRDAKSHTTEGIALTLNVSSRTIHRDLHYLRYVLKEPIRSNSNGFWLEMSLVESLVN
jgi:DNA-binding NarL/FixJ family response regulator